MKFSVKNLFKWLGFFVLAVLVFVGFVYPFSLVPKLYENHAREMTLERVANGSLVVKESYIEETVRSAVTGNAGTIFTTAFYIAAAVAVALYCISIRPPHDCGGINWFSPIGLIFTAAAAVLTSIVLGLAIKNSSAKSASDFMVLVRSLTSNLTFENDKLFFMLLIPIVFEVVFRGIIFSFLEKIHFSAAIVLSTAAYAVSVYLILGSYLKWTAPSSKAASCAFFAALLVGFVNATLTWRLRSGIPAVLSHLLIAWSAGWVNGIVGEGSISLVTASIMLAVTLASMVFVHTFLAKKYPVFAYDFPFSKHHERMNGWLNSPLRKRTEKSDTDEKPDNRAEASKPAKKEAKGKKSSGRSKKGRKGRK